MNNKQPKRSKQAARKNVGKAKSQTVQPNIERVIGFLDPFHPSARSAMWPDGSAGETAPFQFRQRYTITSDANGNAGFSAYASLNSRVYIAPTLTSAGEATSWGSGSAFGQYASFAAIANEYRITSMGVKFHPTLSRTEDAGYIVGTTTQVRPAGLSEMSTPELLKSYREGAALVAKPFGSDARAFRAVDSIAGTDLNDWSCLTCIIMGSAASKVIGFIEVVYNVEFTAKVGSVGTSLVSNTQSRNHDLIGWVDNALPMVVASGLAGAAYVARDAALAAVGRLGVAMASYSFTNRPAAYRSYQ